MNAREQIARLEEILARVKTRAAEPRPLRAVFVDHGAAHAAPTASPPPEPSSSRDDFATSPPPTLDTQAASAPPGDIYSGWSAPPPNFDGDSSDVDVEVSSEVVEVDIDIDEPMPTESGSVPVAEYSPQAILDEIDEHHARATEVNGPPVLDDLGSDIPNDIPTAQPLANELEEPTPSSSPRPIGEPEPYEEESSPRHTPPPESGKQVAAPSVAPAPRKPEIATPPPPPPPPSLESHTLIGGWREPGLARGDAPAPIHAASAPPAPREAAPPPRLSAEITRGAPLPTTARVATFEGAAPAFKPSSFGDLLDATLEL